MSIRFLALCLCCASLFSCTSPVGRVPVSDLTIAGNNRSAKKVTYSATKAPITQKVYKVQKGDTLYSIGWRSGIAVNDLLNFNKIKKPYIIKIGQILRLTSDKPLYNRKKTTTKSDLASQNENKKSLSACIAQNCPKNKIKKVAQEKTKAYSSTVNTKKTTTKDNPKKKVEGWSWPVQGKLTKKFSDSPSGMQGISIVNKHGSFIHSVASGQVVYAGSGLRGYGKLIIIKHNYDYLSAYAHNETLFVHENEKIKKGQKIASMGDSGTDHTHLHFEIRYRGKSVDPLRYLPKR